MQKFLTKIGREFIYGGHLFSLGAVGIVFASAITLDIQISWDCLLAVYLGIQAAYLYNRYKEIKVDSLTNPKRASYYQGHLTIIPWCIMVFLLTLAWILLFFTTMQTLLFTMILVLFSLLYSIFFKKITKKIAFFKNLFVAGMWTLLVFFLTIYYSHPCTLSVFLMATFIFLRLFIHESFSDIKDLVSDKKEGLLTLIILLGKEKLIKTLAVLSIVATLPIFVGIETKLLPLYSLALLFSVPYSFYSLKRLYDIKINTEFLYYILVDGEFALWPLFILLGKWYVNFTFN